MTIQSHVMQGAVVRTPARFALTAVAIAATLAQTAFANEQKHEEVVVTATRTESNVRDVLADVTVIDREQIDSVAPGRSVGEVLQRFAGVQFNSNGGRGNSQGVSIRGAGGGYTLLLIDGVRYGSLTLGSPVLQNIPVELIERIEVLKGPASALYGSDAVGGVIQIFTKRGKHAQQAFIANSSVTAGENGHKSGSAGFRGAQNGFDYSLNLSRVLDHGISATNKKSGTYFNPDRDGFSQTAFTASLGFAFTPDWRIDSTLIQSQGKAFSDSGANSNPYTEMETDAAKLQLTGKITPIWTSKFSIGHSKDQSKYHPNNSLFISKQTEYKWDNEIKTEFGTLLAGLERLQQKIEPTESTKKYEIKDRDINSFFLGLNGQHNAQFWQINWRRDDNSHFGNANTYGLTYGYELINGLRVHASHGKSIKAPTFNQLYYYDNNPQYPYYGNPSLIPEEGKSNELGLAWSTNNHEAKLIYFNNKIKNLIQADPNSVQQNVTGNTSLKGWTASYAWNHRSWQISAIYDYLKTRKADGKPLDRRAKHQFSLNVDKQIGQWKFGGSALYVGSRNDSNATVKLPSYTTLDLNAEYHFHKDWSLQARIANVTNKNYETAYGYNQLGRAGYLTLKWAPK